MGEEGVQVRQDLVLADLEQRLPLRVEIHRPHRLDDEMADAAVVGGVEDGIERRDVQPRHHDLVRHADARPERLGQGIEHREPLQRLVERRSAVADRVDRQLALGVGGVQRDVEVLESRLQDPQGEDRVRERAEVGGHAEAGEADRLRQLHVLEELGMDRRLAAGEEEHVELAGVVEDELPGRVGLRHRAVRRVELLHAEHAVAVAGAGAADVEHPQTLVPRTALRLVAEADGRRIGRRELAYQRVDVGRVAVAAAPAARRGPRPAAWRRTTRLSARVSSAASAFSASGPRSPRARTRSAIDCGPGRLRKMKQRSAKRSTAS